MLKHLKETILFINDEKRDYSLMLKKLRNMSNIHNENILQINKCIMEDKVKI